MVLDWRWFAHSLWMRRGRLLLLMALMLLVFGCGMLFPILTQRAVDAMVTHKDVTHFAVYLLLATLFMGVEAWLTHVRQLHVVGLGTFIDNRLSNLCFLHMMRLRADRRIAASGSVSVYFQHLSKIRGFLLGMLPRTIFDLGAAVVALAVMAAYSLPVTVGAALAVLVSAFEMKRQLPKIYAASADQFAADGKRLEFFNESYNGLETIKTLALEGRRHRHWRALTHRFLEAASSALIIGQKLGLSALITARISSLAIIAIGCYQIGQGQITIGDLIALQLLSFRLQAPATAIGDIVRQYEEANIALSAIRQFLLADREQARTGAGLKEFAPLSHLEFQNVSLTHKGNPAPSLSDISFRTPDRGLVALVGRNGAGKTTLLNILLGLQRDYEGCVTLDGKELRDYHPRYLRSRIGVAGQDATLFAGTVRSNLDVGLAPVNEREMAAALSLAGAGVGDQAGLDREIKEFGRNLSGGQRQRLAVARSLIGTPPILVLDEPTAFLDAEAARRLDGILVDLSRERLLLMVSHNLSATRSAILIVVLKQGSIAGVGRHEDLLATCDEYKLLWQSHRESLGIKDG